MNILVYGAGAVGGYLAAQLAQNGHQVTIIVRDEAATAIKADGLMITIDGRTYRAPLNALSSVAEAFNYTPDSVTYDLIILAMKSYDLEAALDPLLAFCTRPTTILGVQNGIGSEAPLLKHFSPANLMAGSFTLPISRAGSNSLVVERADGGLGIAPMQSGQDIQKWAQLFRNAGINTLSASDYRGMRWSKAMLNIIGNASSAILNRSPNAIYKLDPLFDMEIRMLREALQVMRGLKLKLIDLPGYPSTRLSFGTRYLPRPIMKAILTNYVRKGRGEKMPSFHIDLMANKGKSEVIYHNGAIAQAGEKLGIMTPVNSTLTTVLLKLVHRQVDWHEYDGNATRLLQEIHQTERMMQAQRQKGG